MNKILYLQWNPKSELVQVNLSILQFVIFLVVAPGPGTGGGAAREGDLGREDPDLEERRKPMETEMASL